MTKQEHLDLIRENGYNVPEFVDTGDCVYPFSAHDKDYFVIGDDAMNTWEFYKGEMIGKCNLMHPNQRLIVSCLNEDPTPEEFYEQCELWEVKNKRGGVELKDAHWR